MAGILAITIGICVWLFNQAARGKNISESNRQPLKPALGPFKKRFYSEPKMLLGDLNFMLHNAAETKCALQSGRVNEGFRKRIMLTVTGVNKCRYCSYGHSSSARQSGMSIVEIGQLLEGDLSGADPSELTALRFAIHYAESEAKPEPESVTELEDVYGTNTARDILMILHMISFGNMLGNTVDAFFSRLKGAPARESDVWDELATLALFLASIFPYSLAISLRMAVAQVSESTRSKMLVLQS